MPEPTVGEVCEYLERVKVPVNVDGFVMQHHFTIQLDEAGGWKEIT